MDGLLITKGVSCLRPRLTRRRPSDFDFSIRPDPPLGVIGCSSRCQSDSRAMTATPRTLSCNRCSSQSLAAMQRLMIKSPVASDSRRCIVRVRNCGYTDFQSIINVGVWNVSISFFEHLMQRRALSIGLSLTIGTEYIPTRFSRAVIRCR